MDQILLDILDQIAQFIIANFKILMSLNVVYLSIMLAAYIVVNLEQFRWRHLRILFNRIFLSMVMVGVFSMFFF